MPCAFITGITGQFFRQFALTIAVSTVISAFNSLTLSPALAALLLKPRKRQGGTAAAPCAFVLLGGWLGYQFLGPLLPLRGCSDPQPAGQTEAAANYRSSGVARGGRVALLGAVVGWVFGNLLNWLLAWLFRLFNQGFDFATSIYTRWWASCCESACWCCWSTADCCS